jgi:DNA-nicking Smr family endonuclease
MGVRPLADRTQPVRPTEQALPTKRASMSRPPGAVDADEAARERLANLVGGGFRFQLSRDEDGRIEGLRSDAHRSNVRTLRGSEPEATLDLHGLRADEAERQLVRFVRARRSRGDRVLLVIHGRGTHSEGTPVLGERTVKTLSEGGAAPFVLAFASAPPHLGGLGALLVRLAER